jgi:hypothetical protein
MENDKIIIGIDPAFRENGFSICVIENKVVSFLTFKRGFLDFQAWVINTFISNEQKESVFVGVENSNLQNINFSHFSKQKVSEKVSRNIGANQAISQLTVDFCTDFFGAKNVKEISPKEKGKKQVTNEVLFFDIKARGLSCLKNRVNQDNRDSYFIAMKCFG